MNYKIIENLLGKIISKDEIQNICNTMQDILKEKGLDMTITPEFFISAYHHDKYFLKVVESLLIDAMIPYNNITYLYNTAKKRKNQ